MKPLLDAADVQTEYGVTRRQAYALVHAAGVRISPRRWLVLRSALDEFLMRGGGAVAMPPSDQDQDGATD